MPETSRICHCEERSEVVGRGNLMAVGSRMQYLHFGLSAVGRDAHIPPLSADCFRFAVPFGGQRSARPTGALVGGNDRVGRFPA